ncbi:MAG: hypothetical protein H0S85_04820 [Desulfovibrionaceae bacterium]|jgi:hypothetical protein|nr:hypothetical protein [Desulfovibrionaceae bacterium]
MKSETSKNEFVEFNEIIGKLRDTLRVEVLSEIKSNGMRESMIGEYKALANAAGTLIAMLQKYDFPELLHGADSKAYEEIMRKLSLSGIRCHILVEASRSADQEAVLAMATPMSQRLN